MHDLDADALLSLMRSRRSVRKFASDALPEDTEAKLVEAFRWAPTGGNAQPWYVLFIRSEGVRQSLAAAALSQRFIAAAPLVMVVCADLVRAQRAYGERGAHLYCIQDTSAALQNVLLLVHAMGLAACWVGAFNESEVQRLLGLPNHLRPVALVPIGAPAESPTPPNRLPAADISETR